MNTKHTDTLKITENNEKSDDTKITWSFESIDPSIVKTVYNLEVENDNTYVTEFGLFTIVMAISFHLVTLLLMVISLTGMKRHMLPNQKKKEVQKMHFGYGTIPTQINHT